MRPAFSDLPSAAAFALLLLVLISAPAAVGRMGLLDRADVYPTLPVGAGPIAHIQHEIFEESSDLDVAFIGSSFMWSAIDAPYVQEELTRTLGREARVTVLASVWPGLDRDYAFLRDLLAQRRVSLVVLQFPNRNRPSDDPAADVNRVSDQPHVQAFRIYRAGEFPEVGDGLHWRGRAALYAGAVLGMPRHLLTELRPNYLASSTVEPTLGARLDRRGYFGASFEPFRPQASQIDADQLIFGPSSAANFRFFQESLPPYQMHFARLIAALLEESDVPAVLLHIPQANEVSSDYVEERMNWLEETGVRATMIGIPPSRLFAGFSQAEVRRFFASDHLNENGARYFTRAVMPALSREVVEIEEAD